MILLEDGQFLGFGQTPGIGIKFDQFRIGTLHPSLLVKDNTIKRISCGHDFTLLQTVNGDVFSFRGVHEEGSVVAKTWVMKDASVKFIQQRNFIDEWTPGTHQNCPKEFKEIVLNLLLCLKIQEIKVPKFVFFILVKQIYENS